MTIYNLYVFDRQGTLIYYGEWVRKKAPTMSKEQEGKLIYGMLFSLRSFVSKISPLDMNDSSFSYGTNKYKLNFYESATGLKLVLNTDNNAPSPAIKELLHAIYTQLYVEYVVKNPIWTPGDYITSELFSQKLDEMIRSSSLYSQRNV